MKQIYLGLGLSLLLPISAFPADKNGYYGVYAATCGNILQWQKDADSGRSTDGRLMLQTWLSGYITATNANVPDTHDILVSSDLKGAVFWVEKWCAENPLRALSTAAEALVIELTPSRSKTSPTPK